MIDCTKITHFASLPTRIFVRHVLLGHSFLHRKRYVITSKWCGVIKMWIKEAKYFFSRWLLLVYVHQAWVGVEYIETKFSLSWSVFCSLRRASRVIQSHLWTVTIMKQR
jgi:hypothetical protein